MRKLISTLTHIALISAGIAAGAANAAPLDSILSGASLPQVTADTALPREQRPNVLLWMLDDVGFAQLSSFGGLIETPNIDAIASSGLRYSNYHTAPICSASRAALLSGRNPHSVHVGGHAASARPYPGYDAHIPASAGSIAANLHQAGYRTFALGKWDHLPTEEASPAGPFRQWPTGQGFDRFYGFLAADTDNWNPTLIRNVSPIATPDTPDYHLNNDLAEQAIAMIDTRDAGTQRAPFFMYWATGTAHAPHHAPKDWIEHYKGRFDMGWDKAREVILESQKAQGLVPESTELAPRPEGMPAWESLDAEARQLYARQMEVFAASVSHADEQFGRLIDALAAKGELDNTMVIITSDNGASAEGSYHGLFNEAFLVSNQPASVADNMPFYNEWGGPGTYPHYSFGWAVAGNTPFRYYKQTAHEGGIHVPLIVSWPEGIAARGELRGQFIHVADIAPTILDATGVPLAETVNNVKQRPMEGLSFIASFADPDAADRSQAQYFEMYGNKSLWFQGWSIATTHRIKTWDLMINTPINEAWELYDLTRDPGQVHDLAAEYPEKVADLGRMFEEQAERYNLHPIGNMLEGAIESFRKGRVALAQRGGVWRFAGPVGNIPGPVAPPVTSASFTMRAKLGLDDRSATGPIFAFGGQLGGIGLYLRAGKPVFLLNTLAGEAQELAASRRLPKGDVLLQLVFTNAQNSDEHEVSIKADGRVLAQGTLESAIPVTFGIAETFGIGIDQGSTVLAGAEGNTLIGGEITDIVFDFTMGR